MNRTIKFRAWSDNRVMTYDIQQTKGGISHIVSFSSWLNNKRHILMQYTGLKDKNGKEIYEGDIITSNLKKPHLVKDLIEFWSYDIPDEARYKKSPYDIEVIGDIYENPKLLEKSNVQQ